MNQTTASILLCKVHQCLRSALSILAFALAACSSSGKQMILLRCYVIELYSYVAVFVRAGIFFVIHTVTNLRKDLYPFFKLLD